jgi:hypothetical protein
VATQTISFDVRPAGYLPESHIAFDRTVAALDDDRHRAEPAGGDGRSIPVRCLGRTIRVAIASRRDEFEQAFHLLAVKYQARGYEGPSPKRYRFTPHHALPGTMTVVAKDESRVVATMSLVPDTTALGLPMECIYGREVAALRREGRRLGEVTSLADHGLSTPEFVRTFMAMSRLVIHHHLRQGGDTWVITVNPRHRAFYRRVLGFAPLGPRRAHPSVRNNAAEAYLMDASLMQSGAPQTHRNLFGKPLPESVLSASGRPADHTWHFAGQSTQVDRRTIREIHRLIERQGALPRWLQGEVPGSDWGDDALSVAREFDACGT